MAPSLLEWTGFMVPAATVLLWLLARQFARAGRAEVWLVSALFPVIDFLALLTVSAAHPPYYVNRIMAAPRIWWVVLTVGWLWWRTRTATVTRLGTKLSPVQSLVPVVVTAGTLAISLTGLAPSLVATFELVVIIVAGLLSAVSGTKQVAGDQRVAESEIAVSQPRQPPSTPQQTVDQTPTRGSSDTSMRPAEKTSRIFMSYRRDDSADVAGRIYDRLTAQYGKGQVFKDVDSIPLGVDFRDYLHRRVGSCDVFLAVIGPQWHGAEGKRRLDDNKDFVRIELEAALQRQIPVIPVLVRGAQVPQEGDLPPSISALAYRNGINVRADPDFHHDMDRLIEGVESHLGV